MISIGFADGGRPMTEMQIASLFDYWTTLDARLLHIIPGPGFGQLLEISGFDGMGLVQCWETDEHKMKDYCAPRTYLSYPSENPASVVVSLWGATERANPFITTSRELGQIFADQFGASVYIPPDGSSDVLVKSPVA